MKKTLVLFILILSLAGCKEQNGIMQQLEKIDKIAFQRGDSVALEMLENIVPETIDNEKCLAYYWLLKTRTEIRLSKDIQDTATIDLSINYYQKHKDKFKLARAYGYKAHILKSQGNLKNASIYLKRVEQLVRNNKDELALAYMAYYSLEEINYNANEHELAIDYGKKALRTAYLLNDTSKIAYSLMALYIAYKDYKNQDSALYYLHRCIPLVEKLQTNSRFAFYVNIGNEFIDTDMSKAEDYINKSIAIKPNAYAYKGLARIYYQRGEKEKAREMWEKALQTDDLYLKVEVMQAIFESQRDEGDYRSASETAMQIAALKDSIAAKEKENDIRSIQEQFDLELKKAHEKSRLTVLLSMTSVLLILITVLTLFLYYRFSKGRRQLRTTRLQLERYRNRLMVMEREGKTDVKEVERLTQKIAELQAKQNAQLENGRQRYEEVTGGGTTVRWNRHDFSDCIEYCRTMDAGFIIHMEQDYNHLTAKYIFFALMEHQGRTDEELQHIMAISQNTVRSYRSRINNAAINP